MPRRGSVSNLRSSSSSGSGPGLRRCFRALTAVSVFVSLGATMSFSRVAADEASMLLFYRKTSMVGGKKTLMPETWRTVLWSSLRAVRDFNERNGSVLEHLPDYLSGCAVNISVVPLDTQSSEAGSVNAYREISSTCACEDVTRDVDIIVGPARSACSTAVSLLAGIDEVPMVSYWSTSPSLSDRDAFPYFFRTIPDDSKIALAVAEFFRDITKHKIVSVLYVADAYGQAYQEAFLSAAASMEIIVRTHSFTFGDETSIKNAIQNIKKENLRSIFMIAFDNDIPAIMRLAEDARILGKGYTWATTDAVSAEGFDDVDASIKPKLHGLVRMYAQGGIDINEGWNQLLRAWRSGTPQEHNHLGMPNDFNVTEEMLRKGTLNDIAAYAYDAVILAGLSMCKAGHVSGNSIKAKLLEGDFLGVSGRVLIDPLLGSRTHETSAIVLNQLRSSKGDFEFENRLYIWTKANESSTPAWHKDEERPALDFIGTGSSAPPAIVVSPEDVNLIDPTMKTAGKVLAGVNIFFSLFFIAWAYMNRDENIVRYAQPVFLIMVAVGCIISSSTILYLGVEDDQGLDAADSACKIVPCLYSLGFIVSYAALFTKIERVQTIFSNDGLRAIKVSFRSMLLQMLWLVAVDGAILAAWTSIDPLTYERQTISEDSYGNILSSVGVCTTAGNPFRFLGPMIGLHFIVLFRGSILAYKTRNIGTAFSESKYISIAMYSNLQVIAIGLPLMFLVANNSQANYFVRTGVVFLNDFTVLMLVFGPKFIDAEFGLSMLTTQVELTVRTSDGENRPRNLHTNSENTSDLKMPEEYLKTHPRSNIPDSQQSGGPQR